MIRILLHNLYGDENRIATNIVAHLNSNGYKSLFIEGDKQQYKLLGVDNRGKEFLFVIKGGKAVSVEYENHFKLEEITENIFSTYFNSLEILMLNLQLTLFNLKTIVLKPDKAPDFKPDYKLVIVREEYLDYLDKLASHIEENSSTGVIIIGDSQPNSLKQLFEKKIRGLLSEHIDKFFWGGVIGINRHYSSLSIAEFIR